MKNEQLIQSISRDTFVYILPDSECALLSMEIRFLKGVKEAIMQNMDNEHFSVKNLADFVHISVSQLNRKLKALIHQTPAEYICNVRLQYAAKLLANNTATVGEIACQVGFKDQANFCRCFKRAFNCTPSQYKLNQKKSFSEGLSNMLEIDKNIRSKNKLYIQIEPSNP